MGNTFSKYNSRWAVLIAVCFLSARVQAIVLLGANDPTVNTTPPTGELAGSGWDFEGFWGAFVGTPIAPQFFLTAKHVGGAVGDTFLFHGASYVTAARFDDPQSDLVIWKVSNPFPFYALLYSSNDEVRKGLVVFGRSGPKQSELFGAALLGQQEKGWRWGNPDGILRWGENTVSAILAAGSSGGFVLLSGSQAGTGADLLKVSFNRDGGPNEAQLSIGDSGGGVFIQSGGKWCLAGINYAVDGPYNTVASGPGFGAAVYDEGGLYKGGEGHWQYIPPLVGDQPGNFYSTRISSRVGWINSVISQSIVVTPSLEYSTTLGGQFSLDTSAQIDAANKTIRTTAPGSQRFYRARSNVGIRFKSIQAENGTVTISFE